MQDFRNLKVWGKGHGLTLELYRITRAFPQEEIYGLTSQIRRAAASIGANIAEGCGRRGDPELRRFLLIAMGSASELEYHLVLARDLDFLDPATHHKLEKNVVDVKRMLASLINNLREARDTEVPAK